jgi:hypothetical protein
MGRDNAMRVAPPERETRDAEAGRRPLTGSAEKTLDI